MVSAARGVSNPSAVDARFVTICVLGALVMAISASDEYASGVSSVNRYAIRACLPRAAGPPGRAVQMGHSAKHRLYCTQSGPEFGGRSPEMHSALMDEPGRLASTGRNRACRGARRPVPLRTLALGPRTYHWSVD